jgi:hypothetical protein
MKSIIGFSSGIIILFLMSINLFGDSLDFLHVILKESKAGASSTLVEKDKPQGYYGADRAFDGLSETSWCEGKSDDGIGEYIYSEFEPAEIYGVAVLNGIGPYKHLYLKNNRVKDFRLTLFSPDGKTKVVTAKFKDNTCGQSLAGGKLTMEDFCHEQVPDYATNKNKYQKCLADKKNECIIHEYDGGGERIMLKNSMTVSKIKLEILSVYKGSKYKDTCISEFRLVRLGEISDDWYKKSKEKKY